MKTELYTKELTLKISSILKEQKPENTNSEEAAQTLADFMSENWFYYHLPLINDRKRLCVDHRKHSKIYAEELMFLDKLREKYEQHFALIEQAYCEERDKHDCNREDPTPLTWKSFDKHYNNGALTKEQFEEIVDNLDLLQPFLDLHPSDFTPKSLFTIYSNYTLTPIAIVREGVQYSWDVTPGRYEEAKEILLSFGYDIDKFENGTYPEIMNCWLDSDDTKSLSQLMHGEELAPRRHYLDKIEGSQLCTNAWMYVNKSGVAKETRNSVPLRSLIFPQGVKKIDKGAFGNYPRVESVHFPDTLTEIKEAAFYHCCNLTDVTIPPKVKRIGSAAFARCKKMKMYSGKFASEDNRCLIVDGVLIAFASAGITEYTIPDGVTKIGEEAFCECSSLKHIIIPEGVTEIGNKAFFGCNSLEQISIPENLTRIGEDAFWWCPMTSIAIPDSVTYIGYEAFWGCDNLKTIHASKKTFERFRDKFFALNE